jgi:hypothetical protein
MNKIEYKIKGKFFQLDPIFQDKNLFSAFPQIL